MVPAGAAVVLPDHKEGALNKQVGNTNVIFDDVVFNDTSNVVLNYVSNVVFNYVSNVVFNYISNVVFNYISNVVFINMATACGVNKH